MFSAAFAGFFSQKRDGGDSTKTYTVVEGNPLDGSDGLNLAKLRLEEYHTPTPLPTAPPPIIEIPTPTAGPSPTPLPTRPATPTPTPGTPPTATPTSPPPPPPDYIPNFLSPIINFLNNL